MKEDDWAEQDARAVAAFDALEAVLSGDHIDNTGLPCHGERDDCCSYCAALLLLGRARAQVDPNQEEA